LAAGAAAVPQPAVAAGIQLDGDLSAIQLQLKTPCIQLHLGADVDVLAAALADQPLAAGPEELARLLKAQPG
jgi:hypothetical protein